ncbi:endoprotease endo-Pro [Coniella lustricola]|uniref:Endoprotease endo-Pro n=1 Tax=Coniella lustricola TaxID=2025994 RepID=A0A2T3A2Y7_9PEZI|nr:endoprotease endo-Pro [Coniella lustricola]
MPQLIDDRFSAATLSKRDTAATVNTSGLITFEQLLDHNDPSKGTFSQRVWYNSEFWSGPGAPVVFFTPGEEEADLYTGYLTNRTITGVFAQEIGGAVVMMEHRYWGESSPYSVLTAANLSYLTLEQSIKDTTYLARNIQLPFDTNGSSLAPNAPWVMAGGSYSGALTGWVEQIDPGTYWAYYATSAVVEVIYDFWQYFKPVQEGMPANCSSDVQKVISYVDSVLTGDDADATQALKEKFGLGGVTHNDDFAEVLANGPYQWQGIQFYEGYNSFSLFCDTVENVGYYYPNSTTVPTAAGVGLAKALDGYATYIKEYIVDGYCESWGYDDWTDEWDVGCFDSYNASSPIYTDESVYNAADRQWVWFLCNEPFAYWQDGAPKNESTIVSRLVSASYQERQCALYFPPTDPGTFDAANKTTEDTNEWTHGWYTAGNTTRLIWTNGQYDPWLDTTVSSVYRPGGPFEGSAGEPVQVIPLGNHCSDMIVENGAVNEGVQNVIDNEVAQIVEWVDEFYTEKKKFRAVKRS